MKTKNAKGPEFCLVTYGQGWVGFRVIIVGIGVLPKEINIWPIQSYEYRYVCVWMCWGGWVGSEVNMTFLHIETLMLFWSTNMPPVA